MLLGGINIPEPLLTAYEEGRLVIFTGAGISMSPPSNLPNFLGLAELIGVKLQSTDDPTPRSGVTSSTRTWAALTTTTSTTSTA